MLDLKVYEKVQVNLLKRALNIDSRMKLMNFQYRKGEEFTDIINSYYVIRIPNHYMFLDIDKIFDKPNCSVKIEEHEGDTVEKLIPTNVLKVVGSRKKGTLRKFVGETIGTIWIDEDFLKVFGDFEYLNFRGIKENAPVYIYDNNELVGMILPVKVVEGANT